MSKHILEKEIPDKFFLKKEKLKVNNEKDDLKNENNFLDSMLDLNVVIQHMKKGVYSIFQSLI